MPDLNALFEEIGLDPTQVLQWPTLARRGGENVLQCELVSGFLYTVSVSADWMARYLEVRRG